MPPVRSVKSKKRMPEASRVRLSFLTLRALMVSTKDQEPHSKQTSICMEPAYTDAVEAGHGEGQLQAE